MGFWEGQNGTECGGAGGWWLEFARDSGEGGPCQGLRRENHSQSPTEAIAFSKEGWRGKGRKDRDLNLWEEASEKG